MLFPEFCKQRLGLAINNVNIVQDYTRMNIRIIKKSEKE